MAPPTRVALLLPLLILGARCDPSEESGVPRGDSTPETHDSEPEELEDPYAKVSARLHEDIETIVYVAWEQLEPATVWVEYGLDGEDWHASPTRDLQPGPQEALLLGCPYDSEVGFRVVAAMEGRDAWSSQDDSIQTGEQPSGVPVMDVVAADEAAWDPDLRYLLASIEEVSEFGVGVRSWTFILDRQGRVVWALETPTLHATIHARLSWDGTDLLVDHNSFYAVFDWGATSQVARYDIDGTQLALYDTPGLHHPFTDMPDGSIVYLATADTYDSLVQLHPSGEAETLWGCQAFQEGLGIDQYCTSNSVAYHQESDRFLVSFYSSESVVEIDRARGEAVRWFGHLPQAWDFEPSESAFWWQHGAHYTSDGTLLVSACVTEDGEETVAREYELDEEGQLLHQVWSFGEGEGVYGQVMGEAHRLPGGNTLHNYGSGTRVREITPDGEVVWDLTFSSGTYLGRTTPIADLYALAP